MMCSLLYFTNSEEVLVFKTVEKKCKLAKAAYLGPNKDEDTNGNDKVIHSRNMNWGFMAIIQMHVFFVLFWSIFLLSLDMYSLLQLRSKYLSDGDDEIPLPEINSEGNTTLNELEVNKHFPRQKAHAWTCLFQEVSQGRPLV